jgi:hypothetical protein
MEVKENIKVLEKQVISENNSNESKKVTKNEEKNEESLKKVTKNEESLKKVTKNEESLKKVTKNEESLQEDKLKVQNNILLWGGINYII